MKKLTYLSALLLATLALSGCCVTKYSVIKPDGTKVAISNNRFLWTTDAYAVQFNTNGASITVSKSSTDNAALGTIAQGVATAFIQATPVPK